MFILCQREGVNQQFVKVSTPWLELRQWCLSKNTEPFKCSESKFGFNKLTVTDVSSWGAVVRF